MFDLLIKNGVIVDGSGAERYTADVAVKDGKIAKIAQSIEDAAAEVIDARGLIVSPGFIDWHSHSDLSVLKGFDAPNILEQGITLEIAGHCGVSAVPFAGDAVANTSIEADPERVERIRAAGGDFKAFVEELGRMELPTNIAAFFGHGNVRAAVMGSSDRDPDEGELERMRAIVRRQMEGGAMGMSTGLIYPPGSYAKPHELIELARVTAEYEGAIYASHMRNEGDRVVESVKETLELGQKAGIPVDISHHKIAGKHNKGKSVETLRLIDEAKARGQVVYLDQYPYDGGGTSLMSALPPRYATEGAAALLEKLKDPQVRAEIRALLEKPGEDFENLIYASGLGGVLVACEVKPEVTGLSLLELAERTGKDPYDSMFDLLIETNGAVGALFRLISVWDMENILRYPYTMAGIDGAQSPSEARSRFDHPRGWSTYPRLIGTFCRERGFFTLEACIRRFTGLAADAAGFAQKGYVREGMDADLVLFDFDRIAGEADYNSADTRNEGIAYVFVNGVKAVEGGVITGGRGGKVLLRGGR